MTEEQLMDLHGGHWGEHPDYPVEEWVTAVYENCTRSGYWQWVQTSIANEETIAAEVELRAEP